MHVTNSGITNALRSFTPMGPETNNNKIVDKNTYPVKAASLKSKLNHIPRPRNAFIIFRSVKAAEAKKNCKIIPYQSEISRQAASDWKKMSSIEKAFYYQAAKLEKTEHKKKYPDYKFHSRKLKKSDAGSKSKGKAVTSRKRDNLKKHHSGKSSVSGVSTNRGKTQNAKKMSALDNLGTEMTHQKRLKNEPPTMNESKAGNNSSAAPLHQDSGCREVSHQNSISSNEGYDNQPKLGEESFTESKISDLLSPFDKLPWLRVLEGESLID
ncbi:HMG-box domain-containing protein [Endozoicomonas sp. YOMI1]|uniref:HMG-box domain-containing protein n=1 Tax=Endozoicomonas sp. YOMI1 TaxID=2828739 RepID=UPI002148D36D|nr:HMG-box domain-containing protein [Endozoicomonas sp. YOMI1]